MARDGATYGAAVWHPLMDAKSSTSVRDYDGRLLPVRAREIRRSQAGCVFLGGLVWSFAETLVGPERVAE